MQRELCDNGVFTGERSIEACGHYISMGLTLAGSSEVCGSYTIRGLTESGSSETGLRHLQIVPTHI